ncbi:PAAR domain-containing protein [Pseudomonas nitroreducens]|uniref:PAAR domain-containing protein n=1 Tax=Pseudomonas nitroreducens TaxID=46680 RepID=A0A5R8ZYN8_PSENT|nr:PAAR domain-containing protein [Pseudomonas nitroreducens]TLP71549.1 PAAR domain-containing protein [Pseudomonas nitroreducens]
MTLYRPDIDGKGQALAGDRTTTGALLISYITPWGSCDGRGFVLRGDKTTDCPKCGKPGVIVEGAEGYSWEGIPIAVDRCIVSCDCPDGSNRIIAPLGLLSTSTSGSVTRPALAGTERANQKPEKKVTQLFWSYGDSFIRLNGPSRHYVDLNLHAETQNYQPGESISVIIEYADGDALINDARQLNLTGTTNAQGAVIFRNLFKNGTLNLK